MKAQTVFFRCSLFVALWTVSLTQVQGQQGRNIDFLRVVPQSAYLNPAIIPPYDFYIGFPALSSLKIDLTNTPFHYKDVIKTRSDDSLYIDTDLILSKLQNKNYLLSEFETEFLAFGFRVKKAFISFNLSEKFSEYFMYPKELLSFVIDGNAQYLGTNVNIGGFDMSVTQYHELALGLSYAFNKKISAGVRAKYLVGLLNLDTRNTDINIYSPDEFTMNINTNLLINASIPGDQVNGSDSLGIHINTTQFINSLYSFQNSGFACDLGVQFMPNDRFTIGASVTDLGFISWKSGVRNVVTNKETSSVTYSGIDIGTMFSSDSASFTDQLQEVLDSIRNDLGLRVTYERYTSSTVPKIYLSGIYNLTWKDHFGALLRMDIFKGNVLPSFNLNYTREFGKAFSLTAGYGISKNSYTNFALGFAVNAGPFQLYFLTDNILGIVQLTSTKFTNTHFGINLVFGRSKWYQGNKKFLKNEKKDTQNQELIY